MRFLEKRESQLLKILQKSSQMAVRQYNYDLCLSIVLFQALFNILYDEKVDCKLEKSNLAE